MSVSAGNCWAKTSPYQSVATHSTICGRVAQVLASDYLSEGERLLLAEALGIGRDSAISFVGYLASLHDIGKLEYSFQAQSETGREMISSLQPSLEGIFVSGIRHEKTGQNCLKYLWREYGEDRQSASLLSKIVGAHHQGKQGSGMFNSSSVWYEIQKSHEEEMRRLFLPDYQYQRCLPNLLHLQ